MKNDAYKYLSAIFYDLERPQINQEQFRYFSSYLKKDLQILEPMCGSGRFLINLLKNGYKVDGFDLSKDMIELCQKK